VAVVKLLLMNQANVNIMLQNSTTPLHEAIKETPTKDSIAIIKLLLENNADMNVVTPVGTPLHVACRLGNYEVVKLFVQRKVNVNAKNHHQFNETALHIAARNGNVQIAELLMDALANYDALTTVRNMHMYMYQCAVNSHANSLLANHFEML
jgi:ankyrin repeat protein